MFAVSINLVVLVNEFSEGLRKVVLLRIPEVRPCAGMVVRRAPQRLIGTYAA